MQIMIKGQRGKNSPCIPHFWCHTDAHLTKQREQYYRLWNRSHLCERVLYCYCTALDSKHPTFMGFTSGLSLYSFTLVNGETQGYLYTSPPSLSPKIWYVCSSQSVIDACSVCPELCWCRIQVLYINIILYINYISTPKCRVVNVWWFESQCIFKAAQKDCADVSLCVKQSILVPSQHRFPFHLLMYFKTIFFVSTHELNWNCQKRMYAKHSVIFSVQFSAKQPC